MADGEEEREEREARRKWDQEKEQETPRDPYQDDPWQPERRES